VGWTDIFGTSGEDFGFAISAGQTGVYVVGYTDGSFNSQSNPGGDSAFVRRYKANGSLVWTRIFGSNAGDVALAASTDATGAYVAGYTAGAFGGQSNPGGDSAFVRRYNANGSTAWTSIFGSSAGEQARGIAADSNGAYVAGYTFGAFGGETNPGSASAFLRRYNANGTVAWTRIFGSAVGDAANAVALDGAGGAYVAGSTDGAFGGQSNPGGGSAFVQRYDSTGTLMWTRIFGSNDSDDGYAVAANSSAVFVGGVTDGSFGGQSPTGAASSFVRKYSATGSPVWLRIFGSPSNDVLWAVDTDDEQGVYVAGASEGSFGGQTNPGDYSPYVRHYSDVGGVISTRIFGSGDEDLGQGVAYYRTALYVTGWTWGTFNNQANPGGRSAFAIRMAP
jgi:hypothetical protein